MITISLLFQDGQISMYDIRVDKSNHVRFRLKSAVQPELKIKEPSGWNNDDLNFVRHEDYHGILIEFTGDLTFHKEAKEYIQADFEALGINSNMELKKYELTEVGGVIKWALVYVGYVDYTTKSEVNHNLSVKFNSNKLENIIDSRKSDEFDFEREYSIDDVLLEKLKTNSTELDGIELYEDNILSPITDPDDLNSDYIELDGGKQKIDLIGNSNGVNGVFNYSFPIMKTDKETSSRISSPDAMDINVDQATKMFFVDSTNPNDFESTDLKLDIFYNVDVDFKVESSSSFNRRSLILQLCRLVRPVDELEYEIVSVTDLHEVNITNLDLNNLSHSGSIRITDLAYNEGLILGLKHIISPVSGVGWNRNIHPHTFAWVNSWNINVSLLTKKEKTTNHEFLFIHEAVDRLMNIITSRKDAFNSRLFGRKELGYINDGEYGLIGIISGYWIRNFDSSYELYKSMTSSLDDIIDSLKAVFNIGVGIEIIDGVQKLVIEDLKYFYQNETVVELNKEIYNYKSKIKKEDYFSTIEMGYSKGGEYDDAVGLDEPNRKTSRITPINKVSNTYRQVSSIRADDIGSELIRKLPADLFPKEDTSQDDNNWFLDLKRNIDNIGTYVQKEWADRLRFEPENLSYSSTFKSFLFTPLRMFFRHSWVLRAGMNELINLSKNVSHSDSDGNSTLKTWFKEDTESFSEDQSILVKKMSPPLFKPNKITFNHKVDKNLLNLILGKTQVLYNDELVMVPNYYFKFSFSNPEGKKQSGYLTSFQPKSGEFEFIEAYNN